MVAEPFFVFEVVFFHCVDAAFPAGVLSAEDIIYSTEVGGFPVEASKGVFMAKGCGASVSEVIHFRRDGAICGIGFGGIEISEEKDWTC